MSSSQKNTYCQIKQSLTYKKVHLYYMSLPFNRDFREENEKFNILNVETERKDFVSFICNNRF